MFFHNELLKEHLMQIFYKCIIQIASDNQYQIKELVGDVDKNIRELLEHTVSKNEKSEYEIIEEKGISREVITFAQALTGTFGMEQVPDLDTLAGQIAAKYLDAAEKSNEPLRRMGNKVKTGNLLLAMLRDDSKKLHFIAAQIDNEGFFESETLEKMSGFPDDNKKIWKTAVFSIAESPNTFVERVFVDMKGQGKYWTESFLGLKAKRLARENTNKVIQAVDRVLRANVEKFSEQDYAVLRFTFLHKMLQDDTDFNYYELVNDLFKNYTPRDKKFNAKCIEQVTDKLLKLPDEKRFDTVFVIDSSAVKSDTTDRKFEVSNGVELKLAWGVNPYDVIFSDIDETDGSTYIKIRCSAELYEKFRK